MSAVAAPVRECCVSISVWRNMDKYFEYGVRNPSHSASVIHLASGFRVTLSKKHNDVISLQTQLCAHSQLLNTLQWKKKKKKNNKKNKKKEKKKDLVRSRRSVVLRDSELHAFNPIL
jgi:hypothetical protein